MCKQFVINVPFMTVYKPYSKNVCQWSKHTVLGQQGLYHPFQKTISRTQIDFSRTLRFTLTLSFLRPPYSLILLTVCHTVHSIFFHRNVFPNFPRPVAFFQDFPVLENAVIKFQDYPGFPGPLPALDQAIETQ